LELFVGGAGGRRREADEEKRNEWGSVKLL
jgi:hypothetical protein